jgi:hypothetical protein
MEKFTIGYKILFTVQVLHRYFLNFGDKAFDAAILLPDDQKAVQLLRKQYETKRFWQIQPDNTTRQTLKNYRMVFKETPEGFRLGVETDNTGHPSIPFPTDLKLVFEVYQTDDFFMVYTNIKPPVMDAMVRANKVFRLKNTGTASETLNSGEEIPSISLETYQNTEGGLKKKPLGYIEISHNPTTSLLSGGAVQNNLIFTILLGNRETTWVFEGTHLVPDPLPLVANGLIVVSSGVQQLPNPTPATTFYKSGNFVSIIY